MAVTTNPTPAPQPRPTPQPTTDPNAPPAPGPHTVDPSAPPPPPTPTQEEADAIKSGEYDAMAAEGQRVKRRPETEAKPEERRSMEAQRGPGYPTR